MTGRGTRLVHRKLKAQLCSSGFASRMSAGQTDYLTPAPLDKSSKQIARINLLQLYARQSPAQRHCRSAIKDRITPGMIRHVCIFAAVLQRCASLAPKTVGRRSALAALASSLAAPAHAKSYQSGLVFEGGAGGLTKTKPNTGVKQAVGAVDDERPKTTPAGPVAARLAGRKGLPVDVSFDAPFPTTPGLVRPQRRIFSLRRVDGVGGVGASLARTPSTQR